MQARFWPIAATTLDAAIEVSKLVERKEQVTENGHAAAAAAAKKQLVLSS